MSPRHHFEFVYRVEPGGDEPEEFIARANLELDEEVVEGMLRRFTAEVAAKSAPAPRGPSLADLVAGIKAGDHGALGDALRKMAVQAGIKQKADAVRSSAPPPAPAGGPRPFDIGTRVVIKSDDPRIVLMQGRTGEVVELCDANDCRRVTLDARPDDSPEVATLKLHVPVFALELQAGAAGEHLS